MLVKKTGHPALKRPKAKETNKRSIAKAITYRVFIMILDFSVMYALTRQIAIATGFVLISNVYTTLGYYLHERAWAHVEWGSKEKQ